MEELLIEFVNTFDLSLKKVQLEAGAISGFSELTVHQLRYIEAVHALGTPSITEIAAKLKFTKASVTASVNKLCHLGYLLKEQSTSDKRVFRVNLTEKAEELVKVKLRALNDYSNFITSALNKEEVEQFETILTKIVTLFSHT
jgi:DNA-binding MarR family transcriptional regulator